MAGAATMAAASEAAAGWEAAAGAMEAMVGGGEASAEQVGAGSKHSCRRHEARSYRYNTMSRNGRGHAPHIAALRQRLDDLERWALRFIEPHQTLPTAVTIVAGSGARS